MDKRKLFQIFNKAAGTCARDSRLDRKRINRALGLLQQNDQSWRMKYKASIKSCQCQDAQFHPDVICKHRLARMIEFRMEWGQQTLVTAMCQHQHTAVYTTGGQHFSAGEYWDDLKEHVTCLDCGRNLPWREDKSNVAA